MPLGIWRYATAQATLWNGDPVTPRKKGHPPPPNFLARVYCSRTAGWIKMPLGTEVNVGSGDVVLDDVAAPPKRGSFRFMYIVAKRLDG